MAVEKSLTDYSNAEKVRELLGLIKGSTAEISGDNGNTRRVEREYSSNGRPLVHASEIYSNGVYELTESETFRALNILVKRGEAQIINKGGFLWYFLQD